MSKPNTRTRRKVPLKQAVTWTDDDLSRLLALNLRVCQWVKPKETVRLYGITQRLSAMRMRKDGSAHGHQMQETIERIPDLSAEHCAFLYEALKRVLDGKRDAFKAFRLAIPQQNPGSPRTAFMAADYELARRILSKPRHKGERLEIAERYSVTPPRVSQAHTRYLEELDSWIAKALELRIWSMSRMNSCCDTFERLFAVRRNGLSVRARARR